MVVFPISTETRRVAGPPQGRWTAADWEALPDDGNRYEIVEGVLYASGVPSVFHQWVLQKFYEFVGMPLEDQGAAHSALARVGVILSDRDAVQPDFDLVLVQHVAQIHDGYIWGAPDLIAEVLSPGTRDYDEDVKLTAYARAGVPEYVVLDPGARTLRYYRLVEPGRYDAPQEFGEAGSVEFLCAPGIAVRVGALFEGSPDTTV